MTTALIVITKKGGHDSKYLFPGSVKHSDAHGTTGVNDDARYFLSVHSGGQTTKYKFEVFGSLSAGENGRDLSGTFYSWDTALAAKHNSTFGTVFVNGQVQLGSLAHTTPDSLITALLAQNESSQLQFTGDNGSDTLRGSYWHDTFDGSKGRDVMIGGDGDDRYRVDNTYDRVVEKAHEGTDTVIATANYTLSRNVENLIGDGTHKLKLTGNDAGNTITGTSFNDTIKGMGGKDIFNSGAGIDTIYGGKGADTFIFKGIPAASDVDHIMDFNTKADIVWLSRSGFAAIGQYNFTGPLPDVFFHKDGSGQAADANDYINYNVTDGKLYYDADGNGAGVRVLLAVFAHHPSLTAADFFVIG